MKRYRLDPENPPQLTPEEARRLDETPIDYSDSPLFGEDWIAALLLAMVIEHCAGCSPEKRRRRIALKNEVRADADAVQLRQFAAIKARQHESSGVNAPPPSAPRRSIHRSDRRPRLHRQQ